MSTEWQKTDILIRHNFALAQAGKIYLNSIAWGRPEGNPNWRPPDLYFSRRNWTWTSTPKTAGPAETWIKKRSSRSQGESSVSPKSRGSCQATCPFACAVNRRAASSPFSSISSIFCFPTHPPAHGKMETFLWLVPTGGIWGVKKKPQCSAGNIKCIPPLVGDRRGVQTPPLHPKSCQSPKLPPDPFCLEEKKAIFWHKMIWVCCLG